MARILCIEEERIVGNDNCVSLEGRKLQIPESPLRPHFGKAMVKVRRYPGGGLAVFHEPRCIRRYTAAGALTASDGIAGAAGESRGPSCREAGTVLAAVKDASRRDAAAPPMAGPSLTAAARGARHERRSGPGNGPASQTEKYRSQTPLLRSTKAKRADT